MISVKLFDLGMIVPPKPEGSERGPRVSLATHLSQTAITKCVQQDFGVNMFSRENQRVLYASERKTSLET